MFLVAFERTSAARVWLVLGMLLSARVGIGCVDTGLTPVGVKPSASDSEDSAETDDTVDSAAGCANVAAAAAEPSAAPAQCPGLPNAAWDPITVFAASSTDWLLTAPTVMPGGRVFVVQEDAESVVVVESGVVEELVIPGVDEEDVAGVFAAVDAVDAEVRLAMALPPEGSEAYSAYMYDLAAGDAVFGPAKPTLTNEEVVMADVDADGVLDIATSAGTMNADGSWIGAYVTTGYSGSSLVVDQIDPSTPELEVVTKGGVWADDNTSRQYWGEELFWIGGVTSRNGRPFAVYVTWPDLEGRWLDDGSLAWHVGGVDYGYRLALGDTDGDGVDEVCASVGGELRLMELGGSTLQTWPTDPGRMSGSCTFTDLDGDGRFEVLDWNASGLYARLPSTGETLFVIDDFGSGSLQLMSPAVADVDGDGSTDIVLTGVDLASGASWPNSIRVYSSATASWAPTTSVWSSPSFAAGTASPDGRPQSRPLVPGWLRRMGFRAQPSLVGIPDLLPVVEDVWVDCVAGEVSVALRVENRGAAGASGVVLHVSRWTESGWLDDATLEFGGVSAGTLSPGQVVNLPRPGDSEYTVWVSGNERDCNPDDDVVALALDACP